MPGYRNCDYPYWCWSYRTLLWALTCILSISEVRCYNIEVNKVGVARGTDGSQFGYSVAIVTTDSRDTVVLVGGPNAEIDSIEGHGEVQACHSPGDQTINCQWLNITDLTNKCELLRRSDPTRSHCEEDSRLGATIAVNKMYDTAHSADNTIPKVTVCAPGWKNPYVETRLKQNYMTGMCLKLDGTLNNIRCDIDSNHLKEYCWPFATGSDTTSRNGVPIFSYAQAGISAAYSVDGSAEIVGAPGVDLWRGGYKSVQKDWLKRPGDNMEHSVYYGYALATGRFLTTNADNIAVGIPNFYEGAYGHLGRVEILEGTQKVEYVEFGLERECAGVETYSVSYSKEKTQLGSKFGAVLAAIDITGDGKDELFVGAPLYTGSRTEQGRVYVYTSKNQVMCGPIAVLSGSASDYSLQYGQNARFGSSIASVGDLDNNGIQDVAIGAPYEDGGSGAVYIYQGIGDCECLMEDIYVQRIPGQLFDPNIQSFGWSLSGNEDIDDNSYTDFAVGAYASDAVFVLRGRPIVEVGVTMQISPAPIPLDASSLACSRDGVQLCFQTTVTFTYTDRGRKSSSGDLDNIELSWSLDADSLHKDTEGFGRVEFRDSGSSLLTEAITLSKADGNTLTKTYVLDVLMYNGDPEPKDSWTKLVMTGTIDLVESANTDFNSLDPVLMKDNKRIFRADAEFDKQCESLDQCTSDLKLTVDMFLLGERTSTKVTENTTIFVGAADELLVTMDVKNLQNSSYRANVTGLITAGLKRENIVSNLGAIGAGCGTTTDFARTDLNCTADTKLDLNENFKVSGYFDISTARLVPDRDMDKMRSNIAVNIHVNQANHDVDKANNVFEAEVDIKLKYDIHIVEDKELADQVRFKADPESKRTLTLVHKYYIVNKGPSFVPQTYVNISIPYENGDTVLTEIKDVSEGCVLRKDSPLVQTTAAPTTVQSSTAGFTIPDPEKVRRKRAADEPSADASTSDDTGHKNITCGHFSCAIVECKIINLEKDGRHIVNVTLEVHEKALAENKDVREIRYASNATVTDPAVWFGGKVVPFTKTVYAEKWTTFIVESSSVKTEINIWIIIGAVLGAIALLAIVSVVLWKFGFFKRQKHSEVQKWKEDSLYKRKSQLRASAARSENRSSYTPVDNDAAADAEADDDMT